MKTTNEGQIVIVGMDSKSPAAGIVAAPPNGEWITVDIGGTRATYHQCDVADVMECLGKLNARILERDNKIEALENVIVMAMTKGDTKISEQCPAEIAAAILALSRR